jgi:hypothetical protein
MFALVAIVESYVAHRPLEFSSSLAFTWKTVGDSARGPDARSELLCLGDSMVKVAVVPRVLEQRLGRSAYNLAVIGGQAPTSFFVLRRALESGARPRAVVVDFHSNLLAVSPISSAPNWSELVDRRDALDLVATTRDTGLVAAELGPWLLRSYKGRDEIRDAILAALHGAERGAVFNRRAMRRNWEQNAGAYVVDGSRKPFNSTGSASGKKGVWKPHPANVAYVRRFIELSEQHGITVFWLVAPTHPDWQARREELGAEAPFAAFIRAISRQYANLVVVDGRHSGYGREVFVDDTHLNRRGAIELSEALATIMASHLNRPASDPSRWVALPAFQGRRGDDHGIETLAESERAVRARR